MRRFLLVILLAVPVVHADVNPCPELTASNVFTYYTGSMSNCVTSSQAPCALGEPIQFHLVSFTPGLACAVLFQWSFGDGTGSSEQSPAHVYADPGVYDVSVYVASPHGQLQLTQTVAVVGDPPPAFEIHELFAERGRVKNGYLFTIGHAAGAGEWLWDFGDGTTARGVEREQAHVYKSGGKFLVTLTSTQAANSYALEVNVPLDRRRSARH